jgi:hypothetical protein
MTNRGRSGQGLRPALIWKSMRVDDGRRKKCTVGNMMLELLGQLRCVCLPSKQWWMSGFAHLLPENISRTES